MSYTTILAQIKSTLEGVSGVQNVHDYLRWSADLTTHQSLFIANGTFDFWMIERTSAPSEASLNGQVFRNHEFILHYMTQLDDSAASEKTAQQLADDVMDTFNLRANLTLGGTADQIEAAQLVEKTEVEFGGVLCHYLRIGINANEEVTP
jgi:hypothetical protein